MDTPQTSAMVDASLAQDSGAAFNRARDLCRRLERENNALRATGGTIHAEFAELSRWQTDLLQDACEGALVEVSLLDAARQAIAEFNPEHQFLKRPMPNYGVWESQRKEIEALRATGEAIQSHLNRATHDFMAAENDQAKMVGSIVDDNISLHNLVDAFDWRRINATDFAEVEAELLALGYTKEMLTAGLAKIRSMCAEAAAKQKP